jgi:hypothetical protein
LRVTANDSDDRTGRSGSIAASSAGSSSERVIFDGQQGAIVVDVLSSFGCRYLAGRLSERANSEAATAKRIPRRPLRDQKMQSVREEGGKERRPDAHGFVNEAVDRPPHWCRLSPGLRRREMHKMLERNNQLKESVSAKLWPSPREWNDESENHRFSDFRPPDAPRRNHRLEVGRAESLWPMSWSSRA